MIEAISIGKPIVYFYSNKNDLYLDLLNHYGNAVSILLDDDIDFCVDKIHGFCIHNNATYITYEKLEREFTTYALANIINDLISILN